MDISDTIVAKSDQLNADDLLAGPITVTVTGVDKVAGEQPVVVAISGGYRPWKPCKTMRRLLVHAWGAEASAWVGRGLRLYRDPTVRFGGDDVGGIRIEAMTHIAKPISVNLTSTRGKKSLHRVDVLKASSAMDVATFKQHLAAAMKREADPWTREQIVTLMGCDRAEDVAEDDRRELVARLKEPPPTFE